MKRRFQEPGVYKVARETELTFDTQDGWQLVEMFDEVEAFPYQDTVPQPSNPMSVPSSGNFVVANMLTVTKHIPIRVHRYLLRKDADSQIAEMAEQLRQVQVSYGQYVEESQNRDRLSHELVESLKETVNAQAKEIQTAKDAMIKKNAELDRAKAESKQVNDALTEALKKSAMLDSHLRKIWAALGDVQMKSILGNGVENPNPRSNATAFDMLNALDVVD